MKLYGSISTCSRVGPPIFTRASQSRITACRLTSRPALTSSRRRCRPRRMASGAGAGPSTSIPGKCGAARASARAAKSAASASGRRDDQRGETAERRQPGVAPHRRLGFEKPVAVAGGERLHDRLLGHVGLQQHPARPFGAPGAAADLVQQLVGPLRCPQIAAVEPEIGIDHADQSQHREMMPLGDDLGADQQVDSGARPSPRRVLPRRAAR